MTAGEIEAAVFALEEVRIAIRCPARTQLGNFGYTRKAANNSSITEWLEQRIVPIIDGHEVTVLNGRGEIPHGRTRMENLRSSYAEAA